MKKKTYKKFSEAQIKKLKMYWKLMESTTDEYRDKINTIEETMRINLEIDELEFIWVDGCIVGIGDINREWELLQDDVLS